MNRFSLFAAAFACMTAPALAQTNEVYIEQRGVGNQLTLDQSEAENSRVGGLTIGRVLGVPADALQRRPLLRNVLNISVPNSQAALQSGTSNSAVIDVSTPTSGSAATNDVGLLQSGFGNSATVTAEGSALIGSVTQTGSLNAATLNLSGDGSIGSILQAGSNNDASLAVTGGGSGFIGQAGNNINGALSVDGTTASLIQVGNNLAFQPNQSVSVISSAASVTITQTAFGTGN
jgi:hypothetical protein